MLSRTSLTLMTVSALAFVACGEEDHDHEPQPFALQFSAIAGGRPAGCTERITGVGPNGQHSAGVSDVRFYVSNLRFSDAEGNPVEVTLEANEFQYNSADGAVALIDLTGNDVGTCASAAIAFAEGTARTNDKIVGNTLLEDVTSVSFDVGLPQPLMKQVIATTTAEAAPSPMNEMYWSWASGYRHLVFNLAVETATGAKGEGYLHVGSRDCGPADGRALEDRAACTYVNSPKVALANFDLTTNQVVVDLSTMLDGLDFVSNIYDPVTFEVIGQGPGVECHSFPGAPDCAPLFSNLGLDFGTGQANPANNKVFKVK